MTLDPGSGAGSPMSERMQALLSRAVEDQLTEQRQVANLVTEVRSLMAHVASEVEAMRASAPSANDELERSVAGIASDVREAIRVLGDRIDGVTALVHQRGEDLAEIRSTIDGDMRPRVDAVDTALRDLKGAFTGVASRVADLPGRGDVEAMLTRIPPPKTDVPERLDRIEEAVDQLHDGVLGEDGLHARLASLAAARDNEPDVAGTVTSAVTPAVQQAVEATVARALVGTERRMSEHIDEAVLALAEALLRRRAVRAQASPFDTAEIQAITADFTAATAASPTQVQPPAEAEHAPGAAEPAAPVQPEHVEHFEHFEHFEHAEHVAPAEHFEYLEDEEPEHVEPEPEHVEPEHVNLEAVREPATVSAPFAGDELGAGGPVDDDESRKRRPWWRPGD